MKVISRAEAKELKLTRYFTGIACVNGHVAEKLTCNSTCIICIQQRNELNYKKIERGFYSINALIMTRIKKSISNFP